MIHRNQELLQPSAGTFLVAKNWVIYIMIIAKHSLDHSMCMLYWVVHVINYVVGL